MNESMEARITAMILGEASDFERAELAAAIAADPDLAAFAREMEMLAGAMPEAAAAQSASEGWQLAPARRADLLKALGLPAQAGAQAPRKMAGANVPKNLVPKRVIFVPAFWKIAFPLAAAVVVALLVLPAGHVLKRGSHVAHVAQAVPDFEGGSGGFVTAETDGDRVLPQGMFFKADAGLASPSEASESSRRERFANETPSNVLLDVDASTPAGETTALAAPMASGDIAASGPAMAMAGATSRFSAPAVAPVLQPPPAPTTPPASAESELSASSSSTIKTFTGGWGKGVGSGTGVRPPVSRSEESQSAAKNSESQFSESAPVGAEKAKDGLIAYGEPVMRKTSESKANVRADADKAPARGAKARDRKLFEKQTSADAGSTFSLHVADVSFRLAAEALLGRGELPDPAKVRPEEFTAAFDYGDPAPAGDEAVALSVEQARHPTLPATNLVRVSVRVTSDGRASGQPLNLIVLLDKSGSMERPDRAGAARRAVEALVSRLGPDDRVTVATFDRVFRLAADGLRGPEAGRRLMAELGTYGESGTNLEEALTRLAGSPVLRRRGAASGRIVLITDGIANLGQTLPERLAGRAEALRKAGFPMDVVAVGAGGGGDAVLEALARKADGRYFLLADGDAPAAEFAERLAGAFRPAASNVKVQVRFNPLRVKEWSLLGFDEHLLRERDFRDDSVDAAELAAAEQGTAVYMVRIDPAGAGEVGQLSVRFRESASGEMIERTRVIPFDPAAPALAAAAPAMRVAGCATLFAEKLRGGPPAEGVSAAGLAKILRSLPPAWRGSARVGQLEKMLESHNRLEPEP